MRAAAAKIDAAAGSLAEIRRIVEQIRAAWPGLKIILRGDSGFCRDELMIRCEDHQVDFVLGFARNERPRALLAPQLAAAARQFEQTQKPARIFAEFS